MRNVAEIAQQIVDLQKAGLSQETIRHLLWKRGYGETSIKKAFEVVNG